MAEQARAKKVEETDHSQDDPLAELANIMGMTDEEQLGIGADEIELELVRELLGDAAGEGEAEIADREPAPEEMEAASPTEGDFDEQLTDDLADVLAGIDDQDDLGDEDVSGVAEEDQEPVLESADGTGEITSESEDPLSEIFNRRAECDETGDGDHADDIFVGMDDDFENTCRRRRARSRSVCSRVQGVA